MQFVISIYLYLLQFNLFYKLGEDTAACACINEINCQMLKKLNTLESVIITGGFGMISKSISFKH